MRSLFPLLRMGILGCGLALLGCQGAALTSAKLYIQENELDRAKEQLEAAIVANPSDAEAHYLLGRVLGEQGEFEKMSEALNKSEELSSRFSGDIASLRSRYWATEYNLGVKLATAEEPDFATAHEAFKTATVIDPKGVQAWRNLAFTYYQLHDMDGAIETYEKLTELVPADTSVYSNLGALCIQEKRYEEAVEALTKLTQLNPKDSRAHVNLGIACEQLGRTEEAEAAYKKAVELGPQVALAYYGLGNFYWNHERLEPARDAYEKAVELDPSDQDSAFNLAMTYLRLEDDDSALPLLERLLESMPDNGTIWRQLSSIYARKEMITKSKEADAMAKSLGF